MYNGHKPITYRYSHEAERANEDIYDDFEFKEKKEDFRPPIKYFIVVYKA